MARKERHVVPNSDGGTQKEKMQKEHPSILTKKMML